MNVKVSNTLTIETSAVTFLKHIKIAVDDADCTANVMTTSIKV